MLGNTRWLVRTIEILELPFNYCKKVNYEYPWIFWLRNSSETGTWLEKSMEENSKSRNRPMYYLVSIG